MQVRVYSVNRESWASHNKAIELPRFAPQLIASVAVHRKGLRVRGPARETAGMRNVEFDFSKLSVAERIQVAEDRWDSIPESADIPSPTLRRQNSIGVWKISGA